MRIGLGLAAALFLPCATSHPLYSQQPASPTPSTDTTTTQPQKSETEPKPQSAFNEELRAAWSRSVRSWVPTELLAVRGKHPSESAHTRLR